MSLLEKISMFFAEKEHRIGEIKVDAFIRETHSLASEITEHPVENGSTIADHIYNKPVAISIEGIITNTPMTIVGLAAFDSFKRFVQDESNDFAQIAFTKIEEIFNKREPISIATSLKTYEHMVLESLSIERGGGNCASLNFSCTAKQIRVVTQKLLDLPKPKPQSECVKPKAKKGLQETKPVAPAKGAEATKKVETSLMGSLFLGG
jgi:hypothetical protein